MSAAPITTGLVDFRGNEIFDGDEVIDIFEGVRGVVKYRGVRFNQLHDGLTKLFEVRFDDGRIIPLEAFHVILEVVE